MMTMRGPTAKLDRLALKLSEAGRDLSARVSSAVERVMMPLVQQGYNTRTDPYGRPWPQPKTPNPPMERNGKLRKSYEVIRTISRTRWTIFVSNKARAKSGGAYYGAILQAGFRHRGGLYVQPRKQVPDKNQRSDRWESKIRQAGEREAKAWSAEVRA